LIENKTFFSCYFIPVISFVLFHPNTFQFLQSFGDKNSTYFASTVTAASLAIVVVDVVDVVDEDGLSDGIAGVVGAATLTSTPTWQRIHRKYLKIDPHPQKKKKKKKKTKTKRKIVIPLWQIEQDALVQRYDSLCGGEQRTTFNQRIKCFVGARSHRRCSRVPRPAVH
jgi:hypothetical protein